VLCSTVSIPSGQKHVHIDFHVEADEDSVLREIKQQLTRIDNTSLAQSTSTDLSCSPADSTKLYNWTKAEAVDDAARQAKREAKVEALKGKAREIVERVRREERRKRGRPKK